MKKLVGITRVRNESLIIEDTITHFLKVCDHIIMYDDCSMDDTIDIALKTGREYLSLIRGDEWRTNRSQENTRHRAIALAAAKRIGADWCLCFDADERLVGALPPLKGDGFTFRLFDGYLTEDRRDIYAGDDLASLPRMWGPEYRDILMLFHVDKAQYTGPGRREPLITEPKTINPAPVYVKHYGKCLSVEQWEETCDYYATHFPKSFRDRWEARKGKAIHTRSDFGRLLYTWNQLMRHKKSWVKI